jgi:hypothetical protein
MADKTIFIIDDEKQEPAPEAKKAEPVAAPAPVAAAPVPTEVPSEEGKKKKKHEKVKKEKVIPPSRFEAVGIVYFWLTVGCSILSAITLTIMEPWCYCWIEAYKAKNTVIDNKRIVFDGHGGALFGHWILWLFLSIITLGIFAWWVPAKLENWRLNHIHFAEEKPVAAAPIKPEVVK